MGWWRPRPAAHRVAEDSAVATWIRSQGLEGSPAVVCSADAWLYISADLPLLLPTPPIYNGSVLVGGNGALARRVAALEPEVVITEGTSLAARPEIRPVLQTGYESAYRSGSEVVWLREDVAARLLGPATSGAGTASSGVPG